MWTICSALHSISINSFLKIQMKKRRKKGIEGGKEMRQKVMLESE
jgi:hypothetical protein